MYKFHFHNNEFIFDYFDDFYYSFINKDEVSVLIKNNEINNCKVEVYYPADNVFGRIAVVTCAR
jgi:hypothetical protein